MGWLAIGVTWCGVVRWPDPHQEHREPQDPHQQEYVGKQVVPHLSFPSKIGEMEIGYLFLRCGNCPHDRGTPPSRFVLGIHWGPRTQERAALLIAQVVARLCGLPVWLSDGWKAYPAALLQVLGRVYQRRRRGIRGRHPKPRLVAPRDLFYGQVVTVRDAKGKLLHVVSRVVYGGPRRFLRDMGRRGLGATIHPAFMERWYGTLRGLCAPCAAAPGVALRVSAGTMRGCGWWSTSTTLCCRIRACTSRASHGPQRWPADWLSTCGVIGTISGIPCIQILAAASSCSGG